MWVPVHAIRGLFPAGLLTYFSEQGYTEEGPRCPACTRSPAMRQQRIQGVEIDRCLYCLGLWLDGGELFALGGGVEGAPSPSTCDVCGVGVPASDGPSPGGLGTLCRVCRHAQPLDLAARTDPRLRPLPDGVARQQVAGGTVQIAWDISDQGEETLFELRGELPDHPVRGSLTHENRMTSTLRALGVKDVEVGQIDFDRRFLIKADFEEAMLRWLRQPGVTDDLLLLDSRGGCEVRIDRGMVSILGELPFGQPVPDVELEAAAVRVYKALRSSG